MSHGTPNKCAPISDKYKTIIQQIWQLHWNIL